MSNQYNLLPIDSGGVMLSYKCNCRCRHCLYAGGPDWKDWMKVDDASLIFQGLVQTSDYLRGFHLAGGEPFLDFERLLRVMRMATEFGIPVEYIETNAGWCVDKSDTLDKFVQLYEAGLRCILISCSPFHAERVPLNRVETGIRAGYEIFGNDGVIVWVPSFYRQLAEITKDRPIPFEEYVSTVGEDSASRLIQSGYSLISGGRVGMELANFYTSMPPDACSGDTCRFELLESGHAHFDPYGNLIPAYCSGISLGDARNLRRLMSNFNIDRLPIVKTLVDEGPYGLYKKAVDEFDYQPNPDGYIGKCHLCVDVRKYLQEKTDKFIELTPAKFYEMIMK